jgi:hypothetical protein
MTMLRYLERSAHNDAERFIYRHVLQHKARHMTYALEHLQYAIAHQEDMALIMQQLLFIGDRIFARELKDVVLREALAIQRAARRGGDRLDQWQYAAVHGIIFALVTVILVVLLGRLGLA